MEPPFKKVKVGQAPYDNDDEEANLDELAMSPTQFDARQDPLYELDKGRAKAATRLKSAFERIFEKYERDFTGVGDEIDLETGEVVVDNGHLQSLEDEKVRARERSVSSNDEEGAAKKKDVEPITRTKSKSAVKTTSSTHHAHNPVSLGMPSNSYNAPNPAMFGHPIFSNGPSDPLWQTPDIPIPYHQDMFGHAMGYAPSMGYGYPPMLAPGGGYGTGMFSGLTHHRVSTKLPYVKPSKRQSSAPVAPVEDDSGEDDILLGSTTQAVQVTSKGSKPSTPPLTEKIDAQVMQQHVQQNDTVVSKPTPQKQRRGPGRPRKESSPAKAQELIEEVTEKSSDSKDVTAMDSIPEPTNEAMTSLATPSVSQPSFEENSTLAKQIVAKLAQIGALIPNDTASLYSRSRESSRSNKLIEASDEISRAPSSETSDTSFTTVKANNNASKALPEGTAPPTEDVISGDHPDEESEAVQLDSGKETHADKEADAEPEVTTQSQENRNEPPANHTETEPDLLNENSPHIYTDVDFFFSVENSQEPPISYPDKYGTSKEPETFSNDKEAAPYNKFGLLKDIQEIGVYQTPEVSDQGICSNREEQHIANCGNQIDQDTDLVADTEVVPDDPVVDNTIDTAVEAQESDIVPDYSQEPVQSPPRIQLDETNTQVSETQQDTPLGTSIMESKVLTEDTMSRPSACPGQCGTCPECLKKHSSLSADEPENIEPISNSTEPVRHEKDALQSHNLTETTPEAQCGTDEEYKKAYRAKQAHGSKIGQSQSPFDKRLKVTFRPPPSAHGNPSPEHEQTTSRNVLSGDFTTAPSTPKKRQDPAEPGSRSRFSTPAKKAYPLANLILDDEDEDELSLLSSDVPSSPISFDSFSSKPDGKSKYPHSGSGSSMKKTPRNARRHPSTAEPISSSDNSSAKTTRRAPGGPSSSRLPPFTDVRVGRKKRGLNAGPQSSPLARTAVTRNMDLNLDLNPLASTPLRRLSKRKPTRAEEEGDGVRTPGGTVRRCGVDGFTCDRDFCFTCCR
ncbi:hypothetical protein GGR53DRAFT_39030 [Hypoxylon sp. FL1150]|nr:hypothetical protein GGR53DRAFT_39030 [Hypoxylon sp. FL1150]